MTEHTIIIDFMEPEMPGTLVDRMRNLAADIERARYHAVVTRGFTISMPRRIEAHQRPAS
jgi:hypothetical protein